MTSEIPDLANEANASIATATPVVGGTELLNMGISVLVVIGAIVFIGWLYSRSRFVSRGASDVINVVASRALGPRERLLIVEVSNQQLLVGMTSTAVQTLHVFDAPVCDAKEQTNSSGFKNRLRKALQEARR